MKGLKMPCPAASVTMSKIKQLVSDAANLTGGLSGFSFNFSLR
ncbi:MAG TPA: hypothetical protein VF721_14865 [Pyrinomonadaceae bacterium]|jgi:hypothetical protein